MQELIDNNSPIKELIIADEESKITSDLIFDLKESKETSNKKEKKPLKKKTIN